jgi:menaquinol-cytochrome c reductase iron-sulfur subunit
MPANETIDRERRSFLKGIAAVILGAVATVTPLAVGLSVFLQPLRRRARSKGGRFVKVTVLTALPDDGVPRRFTVAADRSDAWKKFTAVPVGAVYLRRTGESRVQAFNAICPHAGCYVDYSAAGKGFVCPCHNSTFAQDGRVSDPRSPSPRGLDELVVEIRARAEVWVEFQSFRTGTAAKVPA